jgi:hypothetical protein
MCGRRPISKAKYRTCATASPRAAAARAQEIESCCYSIDARAQARQDAKLARSTIAEPAHEPELPISPLEAAECEMLEAALTRWMKDHTGIECASVTVTRKPKPDAVQPQTREQVLEEALRKVSCSCPPEHRHGLPDWDMMHLRECPWRIARAALEWKPE